MAMTKTMLDELTAGYKTSQEMEALYSQILQHMINRSLEAQMQAHLGHERHGKASGHPRNGSSRKTVQSTGRQQDGRYSAGLHGRNRASAW